MVGLPGQCFLGGGLVEFQDFTPKTYHPITGILKHNMDLFKIGSSIFFCFGGNV